MVASRTLAERILESQRRLRPDGLNRALRALLRDYGWQFVRIPLAPKRVRFRLGGGSYSGPPPNFAIAPFISTGAECYLWVPLERRLPLPPPLTMMDLIQHGADQGAEPAAPFAPNGSGLSRADLRGALRRVTHDINNPLSIISGNAQLLLELARGLDLDGDLVKPIRDIEEASQQLATMVDRLNRLNDAARTDDAARLEAAGNADA